MQAYGSADVPIYPQGERRDHRSTVVYKYNTTAKRLTVALIFFKFLRIELVLMTVISVLLNTE